MPKKAKAKKREGTDSRASDLRLLKALGHSRRIEILEVLNERMASPNELAKELGGGLSQISYHVKVLKDFECVELVKTIPRRGAVEHFYKARHEAFVPNSLVRMMPKSARRALINSRLKEIDEDLTASLEQGSFYGDRSRYPVVRRSQTGLDGRGCKEAEELVEEFVNRFAKIGAEAKAREKNGKSEGKPRPVSAIMLVFDSALGKKARKKRKR